MFLWMQMYYEILHPQYKMIHSFTQVTNTFINMATIKHQGQILARLVDADDRTDEQIAKAMRTTRNTLYVWKRQEIFTPKQLSKIAKAGYNILAELEEKPEKNNVHQFNNEIQETLLQRIAMLEQKVKDIQDDQKTLNTNTHQLISDLKNLERSHYKLEGKVEAHTISTTKHRS